MGSDKVTSSLRARLLRALLLILIPLVVSGLTGAFFLNRASETSERVTGEALRQRAQVMELRKLLDESGAAYVNALFSRDRGDEAAYRTASLTLDRVGQTVIARFKGLAEQARPSERSLVETAEQRWLALGPGAEKLLRGPRLPPRRTELVSSRRLATLEPLQEVSQLVTADLEAISDAGFVLIQDRATAARQQGRRHLLIVLAALLASLGIAVLAARKLGSSIVGPLVRLAEAVDRVGRNDLHVRVPVERSDELGRVSHSFNLMAERLATSREELAHQAFHDSLTGLPNRVLFLERTERALARSRRRGTPVAVLFLDLDDFKTVNDSLGHPQGDELLQLTARRFEAVLRPAETAARLGGDEFAVLLEDLEDERDAEHVAARVLEAMKEAFVLGGTQVFVRASVGIAVSRSGEEPPDELLRDADLAMYAAKVKGGDHFYVFEPELHEATVERLKLAADLRCALARDELLVHYQPVVALATGEVVGIEALARWQHPELGLLPPDEFISTAERTGLIDALGAHVLKEACTTASELQRLAPGRDLTVAVNVSPKQLENANLAEDVAEALRASGLAASTLLLEITESVLMHDPGTASARLLELRKLGVRVALDDFGTGHSSLGHLKHLPIDVLKIGRVFVEDVDRGPEFVRAIVKLAETLKVQTLAEGVERPGQARELERIGCELGQGRCFAPPMDREALFAFLQPAGERDPERERAHPFRLKPTLALDS